MAIKIITDSTCDIELDKQKELDIEIICLSVLFGEKEYIDGIDLKKPEFFEKLRTEPLLPSTAQVNPDKFINVFKKHLDNGDDIVGIFISGKMSGTCQSAVIAKETLKAENIYIIDSQNVTLSLALLVYEAIEMRKRGLSAPEMYEQLGKLVNRVKLLAVVDTLKYLKKGGRLSSSSAFIGSLLQIKPIITAKDGLITVVGKEKGQKAAMNFILNEVLENKPAAGYKIVFGDTDSPELREVLKDIFSKSLDINNREEVAIGAVVGTHAGPGCVGLAYIMDKE